jgi:histidine triad (HIT) family protein
MEPCPFCEIVAGRKQQEEIVHSNGAVVAFLCEPPATSGHTLIVPRVHRSDIWDVEPAEASSALELARLLAHVMREELGAVGVNLRQNSGARSGQDVFHFHLHVVPRYEDDTVLPGCVWGSPPWRSPPNGAKDRRHLAARLGEGLSAR